MALHGPLFGLGPPHDASLDGHRVDALFSLTAQLTGGCLLVVLVVLVYFLVRYRATASGHADYLAGRSRLHALGVAGLAAFVLIGIDVNLVRIAHADLSEHLWRIPRGADVVRVEVMPQRWLWNVRYAGRDEVFGTADDVVTVNDLRVPVGAPVTVQLVARDVIHSFFLPNFRVKQDAIPGRVTHTWFVAREAGTYDLACAQLCGFAHYQMRATLTAMPRDAYDRWLSRAADDSRRRYDAHDVAAQWGWPWAQ